MNHPTTARRTGAASRRSLRAPLVAVVAMTIAGTGLAAAGPSGADEAAPGAPAAKTVTSPGIGDKVDVPGSSKGATSWFVRLRGPGALAVQSRTDTGGTSGAKGLTRAARDRVTAVGRLTDAVVATANRADDDAVVLYRSSFSVPGVALHADAAAIRAVAARPDVVDVVPIVAKQLIEPVTDTSGASSGRSDTPTNAPSNELTGAASTWRATGNIGTGETIAVIDTGLDYTHADFGGSGVPRDWYAAGRNASMVDGTYDPAIVVPGHDFAGQNYNGQTVTTPRPDENPIDGPGGGHGTHVSGTAAGRGVTAEGTTFTGDYRELTPAQARGMEVAPGAAPGAKILPLKVFGDFGGSTDLAGAALEWVAGAVARGQRIDVVNLSLGSSFSPVDDPENDMVAALVDAGVVPVISAGNSGDVTDVAGSPGDSVAALTVAASASGYARLDTVQVVEPADLAGDGPFLAQYSQDWFDTLDNTGPVTNLTQASNAEGCQAYNADDTARVEGKMVWLEWDQANLTCGSATRFDNAAKAGASGVVLASTSKEFEAGIAGNTAIPGVELNAAATAKMRPAMEAGTLVIRIADELKQTVETQNDDLTDTLASFTSRGVHGTIADVVKPDVSAPGVNIVSAGMGTGTGSEQMSGTSMASPHTAGVVALTRVAHPTWSARRIKTVVMNTAAHEVTAPDGTAYSNLMQGTGRIDAVAAGASQVTVESVENPDLVTASFGVVEVARDGVTQKRTLRLTNTGDADQAYDVNYRERVGTPGAKISVTPSTVTVPAGGTAEVTVTFSVPDREALRRTVDPGQAKSRLTSHVPNTSGVVAFTAKGAAADDTTPTTPPLWVAVFAAPKPVSSLAATKPVVLPAGRAGSTSGSQETSAGLTLTGSGLAQGYGTAAWSSRVTPLVAGVRSPRLPASTTSTATMAGGDILQVGASSTSPLNRSDRSKGTLAVGIQTAGPIIGLGTTTYPVVHYDVDRDGLEDFQTYANYDQKKNVPVALTVDVGTQIVVDEQPVNGLAAGNLGQYDNDTVVLPVALRALGYTKSTKATVVDYWVTTESQYAPANADGEKGPLDKVKPTAFDVYNPPVWFSRSGTTASSTSFAVGSAANARLRIHRAVTRAGATGSVLVIGHDNGTGGRTSRVTWRAPAPTRAASQTQVRLHDRRVDVDQRTSITVTVRASGRPATGRVQVQLSGQAWVTHWLRNGAVTVRVSTSRPGLTSVRARYLGSASTAPSNGSARLTVER
ncbi:S8 family serine peptidase [Nocardioides plantarum]|uniref:S8 family serine peptidase n=1 Tax=Nocardioides plantarum TaxID=29299 RepID=A0ABV5KDY6_9ACTN|nr:S8 family serine peptidase [Nocardioides plantarum]